MCPILMALTLCISVGENCMVGFQNYSARPFVARMGYVISFKGQGHNVHISLALKAKGTAHT